MQRFASFLLSIMLLGGNLAAQSTYSAITGTVTDPTGAVVPGVTVTAVNTATNISTSTEANAAGVYTVAQLMPGTYTLRATLAGFREFRADQLVLEARTYRRLDITMQVGNLTEKVEVTAGISAIETERAKIGDTRQREELLTLPLRASGSTAFLSLTPGVKKLTGSSLATFDGSKAWEGSYSIDGTSYSNASQSGWEPVSNSLEMFAEIKVEHANNSAEFNTLGQVTVVTRSGANQPHGAVFDNYGAPAFRASNPFSRTKGIMVNHRYGASFGGPIWIPKVYDGRNRTFFFINTEMQTQNTNSTTLRPTVAPEPWRRGDFSRFGTPLRDPQGTTPFPGAIIPAARLSAVSRRVQETWFPLPNMGDPNVLSQNNYQSTMSWPYRAPQMFGVRLDQRIGDKDSLFARLSYTGLHQNAWESSLPANRPTEGFLADEGRYVFLHARLQFEAAERIPLRLPVREQRAVCAVEGPAGGAGNGPPGPGGESSRRLGPAELYLRDIGPGRAECPRAGGHSWNLHHHAPVSGSRQLFPGHPQRQGGLRRAVVSRTEVGSRIAACSAA